MSGVIILLGQLGIAAGGFVGMSKLMSWYHSDKKGGEKHGNNNNKIKHPNNPL